MKGLERLERKERKLNKWLPPVKPRSTVVVDAYATYTRSPIEFIEQKLKFQLTEQQKQICLSVRDSRDTNVQASHGCGKTFLAACLCLWWVLCVGGLCITTAPTKRQVNELLWGEVRKIHGALNLPGDRGQTFLRLTEIARAFGFTASDYNSNAFQGIHHDYLLVIEDEACGISNEIDEGASSCTTGANNRFLRIGNPIATGGAFEKACKRKHIRIPVWEHPNVAWAYHQEEDGIHRLKPEVAAAILDVADEVKPQAEWAEWCQRDIIPGAVSVSWIEETRSKYGEGSAYWQARVEGFFPEDAAQSVIPRSWFMAARQRYDQQPDYWDEQAKGKEVRFGLDVGDGGDAHGLARWQGAVLYAATEQATQGDREDVTRAAGWLISVQKQYGGIASVDRGGCGAGALAILLEQKYDAVGVHWGEAAQDSSQFLNSKAEDWWNLREAFRLGEVAVAPLGKDEDMVMEDLAGVYWELTSGGKIRMEDKTKTCRRLKRSPNVGDAIVIGFRNPVTARWVGEW